jgi:hypothetical protein
VPVGAAPPEPRKPALRFTDFTTQGTNGTRPSAAAAIGCGL